MLHTPSTNPNHLHFKRPFCQLLQPHHIMQLPHHQIQQNPLSCISKTPPQIYVHLLHIKLSTTHFHWHHKDWDNMPNPIIKFSTCKIWCMNQLGSTLLYLGQLCHSIRLSLSNKTAEDQLGFIRQSLNVPNLMHTFGIHFPIIPLVFL